MIGSRKTVPPRMFLMVPFGDFHCRNDCEVILSSIVFRPHHLFELELFDSLLIGRDGGTLDTNSVFEDSFCRVGCDLVVGLVTARRAKMFVSSSAMHHI